MGHLLRGEKINFLIRGAEVVSCAGGILSIRGPEVSLGSLRVGNRHAQSPTPHTLAPGSYLPILLAVQLFETRSVSVFNPELRELWNAQSTCTCGVGVYPPSNLTHGESESLPASQKSVLFGRNGTRERQIRQLLEGPQES
jgi:hypothetical protein